MQNFLRAFGAFNGTAQGRRYMVVKSAFADGASQKLVAEALGGTNYISLNLYRTGNGAWLGPCEMPQAKVIAFLLNLKPDAPDTKFPA